MAPLTCSQQLGSHAALFTARMLPLLFCPATQMLLSINLVHELTRALSVVTCTWVTQSQCTELPPLACLQFLKIPLWMYLFRYYIYPSVLVAVVLAGQGMCAYLAYHKAKRLASLTTHTRLVPYVNKGYVRAMKACILFTWICHHVRICFCATKLWLSFQNSQ